MVNIDFTSSFLFTWGFYFASLFRSFIYASPLYEKSGNNEKRCIYYLREASYKEFCNIEERDEKTVLYFTT